MELRVGDKVIGTQSHNKDVVREVVEVRPAGYTWKYLDIPDRDFISENSNDPFFDRGWLLLSEIGVVTYDPN